MTGVSCSWYSSRVLPLMTTIHTGIWTCKLAETGEGRMKFEGAMSCMCTVN